MAKNILIIEDDDFFREILNKKLSSAGFNVSEALEGESGARKARDEKPDLVLSDLILPGIGGLEILKSLKSNSETSSTPFIFLSNISQKEEVEKALKAGAVDFWVKTDLRLDEIVKKIRKALKK